MTKLRAYYDHRPMWAEVQGMEVQDCMRWRIPPGLTVDLLSHTLYAYARRARPRIVLRVLRHKDYIFIVRVA